ncbi:MAG: hypothetical protein GXN99_00900 [Candidatus Nanohaloarchaeota archaeon]|nr:hypothetical protein [Candidatus Nanohaloarchaeota archaeon]
MNLKLLAFSIGFVFFAGMVYGEVIIEDYTKEVYFIDETEKTIEVTFKCVSDNLSVEKAYVQLSDFQREEAYFNGVSFFKSLRIFNLLLLQGNQNGKQILKVICEYDNGSEEVKEVPIYVYYLSLDIVSPTFMNPLLSYIGDFFYNVELRALINSNPIDQAHLQSVKLYLVNESTSKAIENIYYYLDESRGVLKVVGKIPYGLAEDTYDLKAEVIYVNGSNSFTLIDTESECVIVKAPISVEMLEPTSDIELKSSEQISLRFRVYEKGEITREIKEDNLRVYLDDREVAIDSFSREDDVYEVKITLLKPLDIEDYKKALFLEIHDYRHYPSFKYKIADVYYVVKVQGSSVTPDGKVLDTTIYFFGENIQKFVKSTSTGHYETYLPPGTYTLEIKIPDAYAKYEGVIIEENVNDLLRVAVLSPKTRFNVAKGLYLELLLPSSSNYLRIYYSDRYIYNEKNLAVFYCEAWDFINNKCKGDPEDITKEVNINIRSNYVEVWNRSGAFLIEEKLYAVIEASAEKQNYFVGDKVIITGVVRDIKGNGLKGIDVYYEVEGYDIEGKVTSEEKGTFEISFPAPLPKTNKKVSTIKVKLYLKEKDISSEPITVSFNVEKRAKLVVNVDDVVKVKPGEKKIIPIEVMNGGDLILTNIEFRVEGIKTDWYTISPALIESLKPGESKKVSFVVNIPADYCQNIDPGLCKEYYFVNMRVKSEEIREDVSFTLKIDTSLFNNSASSLEKSKAHTEKSGIVLSKYTGKFVEQINNNVNVWIIIGFFIAAFILITIKKRRKTMRRPINRANFYKSLK